MINVRTLRLDDRIRGAKYSIEIGSTPRIGWNDRVLCGKTGSLQLYQSTAWADRLLELFGDEPVYLAICRDEEPILFLVGFKQGRRPAVGTGLRRLRAVVRNLLPAGQSFSWYGEPVATDSADADAYRLLGDSISMHLREKGLRLTGGQWPVRYADSLPSHWQSRRWATLKVDLSPDTTTILSRFKPAARKEIRKAEARGIEVRMVRNEEELRIYGDEAVRCAARYGKTNVSTRDFLSMWKHFRRPGFVFETFSASIDGKFLAGLSIWGTRATVGELGSFQTQYAHDQKLSGPDLIKWRALEWAKDAGIATFDLAGINPCPKNPKEENIRRFKEKWGGQYEEYLMVQCGRQR